MHKIARTEDSEYCPPRTQKKRMPIVSRGAVRDYEEAEDNGEEDPMIAEEVELEKLNKAEKSTVATAEAMLHHKRVPILCPECFCFRFQPLFVSILKALGRSTTAVGGSCATA